MNRHIACTLGITMIAAAACAGPQEATVDLQAETAALRAAALAYHDAARALDADAISAFYMEDAVAYPRNEPTVEGRAGFQEYAANLVSAPGIQMNFGQPQVVVAASGDLGYTYAEGEVTLDGPDGETISRSSVISMCGPKTPKVRGGSWWTSGMRRTRFQKGATNPILEASRSPPLDASCPPCPIQLSV